MKIAVYGYGNLGKGVEAATVHHKDAQLVGVFTRRAPETVKTLLGTPVMIVDIAAAEHGIGLFDTLVSTRPQM